MKTIIRLFFLVAFLTSIFPAPSTAQEDGSHYGFRTKWNYEEAVDFTCWLSVNTPNKKGQKSLRWAVGFYAKNEQELCLHLKTLNEEAKNSGQVGLSFIYLTQDCKYAVQRDCKPFNPPGNTKWNFPEPVEFICWIETEITAKTAPKDRPLTWAFTVMAQNEQGICKQMPEAAQRMEKAGSIRASRRTREVFPEEEGRCLFGARHFCRPQNND